MSAPANTLISPAQFESARARIKRWLKHDGDDAYVVIFVNSKAVNNTLHHEGLFEDVNANTVDRLVLPRNAYDIAVCYPKAIEEWKPTNEEDQLLVEYLRGNDGKFIEIVRGDDKGHPFDDFCNARRGYLVRSVASHGIQTPVRTGATCGRRVYG